MPSSTTSSERTRVVLVDDNEAMLVRAAEILMPCCLVVGAVRDGRSALAAIRVLQPDVVVLDISMPDMNGFEVACRLREMESRVAVVFLTVHAEEAFLAAAKDVGALGYVVKARLASDLVLAVGEAREGRPFASAIG